LDFIPSEITDIGHDTPETDEIGLEPPTIAEIGSPPYDLQSFWHLP
jgi:hypothetical protein